MPMCDTHPDRPATALTSDGHGRCDECARPWVETAERHRRERAEMAERHAADRAALERETTP